MFDLLPDSVTAVLGYVMKVPSSKSPVVLNIQEQFVERCTNPKTPASLFTNRKKEFFRLSYFGSMIAFPMMLVIQDQIVR